jgi:hypothetical protein
MNKNLLVLLVAAVLIVFGLFKPSLSVVDSVNNENSLKFEPPSNAMLADHCMPVIHALRNGPPSRHIDGKRLASLYRDLATLISLDGEDAVIKNTEELRQANKLAGIMLKLDMKDKYQDLATANDTLIKVAIGDDSVLLDRTLRFKAVEGFDALAWACYEGSK